MPVETFFDNRTRFQSSGTTFDTFHGFTTLHEDLKSSNSNSPLTGVIVEAHHDDLAMWRLTRHLVNRGIDLRVVTLTDSSQRNLPHYSPDELDVIRWDEGGANSQLAGVTQRDRISTPDTKLSDVDNLLVAAEFLHEMSDGVDFLVAPNAKDVPDHAAAHEAALLAAGTEIPVYQMDTITGYDRFGNPLAPDWYVPISGKTARKEKRMYRSNTSQVTRLPKGQIYDSFNVLGMTRRRGAQFGETHAAVVFNPTNTDRNPLAGVLDLKPVKK